MEAIETGTVGFTDFTRAEFMARVASTKERMEAAGFEALVVVDPANIHYLTGYDGWSFYKPQCVMVSLDREEPVWMGRQMDSCGCRPTSYLKAENVVAYPDTYVDAPDCSPFEYIAAWLRDRGFAKKRFGVEMRSDFFYVDSFLALQKGLPDARFEDSRNLVNWVRAVKSPKEIELMRRAGKIMDRVMERVVEAIEPGMRQNDLIARIFHDSIAGTEEYGGDYTAIVPLMPRGENTGIPHLTWTDDPFRPDELIVMELGAAHKHYHCPMARTFVLGTPSPEILELRKIAEEGIEAALEAIRPGGTTGDPARAFNAVLARYGRPERDARMGYSIGLGYPPDWGEKTFSLRPSDTTEFRPGMTSHMMPGIWGGDCGIEITQSFVVTETGYEALTQFPRKLIVKGAGIDSVAA